MIKRIAVATAMLMVSGNFASAYAQEEAEVLEVVHSLFDAMARRDTAAIAALSLEEMRSLRIRGADVADLRWGTNEQFLAGLAGEGPLLRERMVDPEIRISGPMATVWGEYDFHVGGEFSHCGVDSFQLVRESDGWKLAQISYTVVADRELCEPILSRSAG